MPWWGWGLIVPAAFVLGIIAGVICVAGYIGKGMNWL